ncbi:hypothetical protein CcaverHIS002_0510910 [Cutaneotrichosporon cavernicola]|uniref:Uncharacterized protein n=1 Tax=Cutaneotrichosporon cavernicola TaxID=279322 RepID=A0AA48L7R7_9TREE|nr:uncharacterized protein CcaverHIS019_0511460 [Cutaneotrichosporon cavernicola]BEI85690.1 hypothetical protein CcaverHIS002_0510910 [Cutaneotrichosporon cavernicola]BEI93518.1 hypothetical protein CcaverHIS019_0511460 [Cutaneotrichosporon cavernicola]
MIQAHSSPAPISFPSIVYKADVGSFPASHHLLSRSLLFTLHACGNEIVILILSHRHPPNLVAVNGPGPATAGSALRSNGRIQTVLICVGSGPNGLGLYQKQADFAHFWNLFEMTWSAISGGLSPEMRGFDRPALLALPLVQDTFCTYFEALFSWLTPAEQDNWAKCFEVKWMVTIVQPGGQQASLEECAFLIACGEAVCNERQRAKLGVWPIYTWPTFTCPRMARLGGTQVHWLYQRIGVAQFHQDYFSRLAQF